MRLNKLRQFGNIWITLASSKVLVKLPAALYKSHLLSPVLGHLLEIDARNFWLKKKTLWVARVGFNSCLIVSSTLTVNTLLILSMRMFYRWNPWMFSHIAGYSNLFTNTLHLSVSLVKPQIKNFKYLMSNGSFLSNSTETLVLKWPALCTLPFLDSQNGHMSSKLHSFISFCLNKTSTHKNPSVLSHRPNN